MSPSAGTATLAYADLRTDAVLAALFGDSFLPPGEDPFAPSVSGGTPPHLAADLDKIGTLASLCIGGSADSSPGSADPWLIASILSATSHEPILAALRLLGIRAIGDRLAYLHQLTGDDDPDEPPMTLSSLQQCALFFASEPRRRDAEVGISPDGLLQAQWRAKGGGVLAIRFLPSGFLQFAAVSEATATAERRRVHGTLPKDQALQAVKPFFPKCRP